MVKKLKMSTLNPSDNKVKNVNIIHKWLKRSKYQQYEQEDKRFKMLTLCTSG